MTKDGGLWEVLAKMVEQRGPYATKISKAKTHAAWEMVEAGQGEEDMKVGNDFAYKAADRGATKSQRTTQGFAYMYCKRKGRYRDLMTRIQRYVADLRSMAGS